MYIFGDGVCTTTTNGSLAPQYYYGLRNSNGRVWVEVLAQRLGLGANSITNVNWSNASNDRSYYGQDSSNLITNLKPFAMPADAHTALFVVWVDDADFVNNMGTIYQNNRTNAALWSAAVNQSLTNHWTIITNLYYAKGARTLLMPSAVDISEIPNYDTYPTGDKAFIRQMVINFNAGFSNVLNQARTDTNLPGIIIYEPNIFTLLDNVITNASAYGLTNALLGGASTDAFDEGLGTNSIGTNYIFWDATDPTAKLHEVLADTILPMIAPVQVSKIAPLSPATAATATNQLNILNTPVGLKGFVESVTNIGQANWLTVTNFSSTNLAQSVFVNTPAGKAQFYRLRFPFSWSYP